MTICRHAPSKPGIAYPATSDRAVSEGRPTSRGPLLVAVVVAALLGLAELPFASFMADDLMQLAVLERVLPCSWLGPLDL